MEKTIIEVARQNFEDVPDWKTLKESGAWGVMIAAAETGYNGEVGFDGFAKRCADGAREAGLEAGITVYIRCKNPFAAHEAAAKTAEFSRRQGTLTLPAALAFFERRHSCLIEQGKDGLTDTALAFLFETKRAGGEAVLYTDHAFADTYLDMKRLANRDFWMADMAGDDEAVIKRWGRDFAMRRLPPGDSRFNESLYQFSQSVMR